MGYSKVVPEGRRERNQNEMDRDDLKLSVPGSVELMKVISKECYESDIALGNVKGNEKNSAAVKELVSMIYYLQRARGMAERFVRANT